MRRFSSWILLAAALLVLGALSALSAPAAPLPPLATASAQPDGALAAYLWLSRIGRPVRVDRGFDVRRLSRGATLLILTPQPSLREQQDQQLRAWVLRGGHLVLASEGDSAGRFLARLGISVVPGLGGTVHVDQPVLDPPVRRLAGSGAAVVVGEPAGGVVASTADGPVLLYRPMGHGILWLLTDRTPLENARLGVADNRRLLLNLVGPRRPVIFEEYQPSAAGGGTGWMTNTAWGAAFLFALLTAVLYRWLSGLRLGPPLLAADQAPRRTAEYVTSLASLMREAGRRADILSMYQEALRRTILERLGGVDRLDEGRRAAVESLLAPATSVSDRELTERARAILAEEERLRSERV
ncbi:MAG TPA: DUF4350 domain-containing protein [Chloroflexota bacterium]|nr:DUF4350 domain-containing protein [Chloroflexota bacterium]